jgi:hypothetical protein
MLGRLPLVAKALNCKSRSRAAVGPRWALVISGLLLLSPVFQTILFQLNEFGVTVPMHVREKKFFLKKKIY